MSTNLVSQLTQEQREIFKTMPKPWQQKTMRALQIRKDQVTGNVMGCYELGEICRDFTNDERNYGEEAVPNLATVMGEDPNNLWQFRQFVSVYKRAEVERLLERSFASGKPLTFSHFDALASLTGKNAEKYRKELENSCIQESLPVTELRERVQRKMGGKRSQGGRPPLKPRSILAGVGQLNKSYEQYHNRWPGWQEVVFQGVAKAGPDQINEELVKHLESGRENQAHLRQEVDESIKQLDAALARAKQVLKTRKAGGDVAPATPAASAPVTASGNGATKKTVKAKPAAGVKLGPNGRPLVKKLVKKKVRRPVSQGKDNTASRVANARARGRQTQSA